jgi:hypothetical protein
MGQEDYTNRLLSHAGLGPDQNLLDKPVLNF